MARIVCLANSYKRGGRCIAGIDLDTGDWLRPIGNGPEGAVGDERRLQGHEPQILDILEIELLGKADNKGCQPENVSFKKTPWRKVGCLDVDDISEYTENDGPLLHNTSNKVLFSDFETTIAIERWKSLQLIKVRNASFRENQWNKIECSFIYNSKHYRLKAPCPEANIYKGKTSDFILTISMGGPYARNLGDQEYCYKMVAGVIEL